MDEQIKPVGWIVGNVSFGPYDFRKTEPRGWGYSEPLIKLSEHRAAIDALRAEVESLRADAERYRWLRRKDAWMEDYLSTKGAISAIFVSNGRTGEAADTDKLDAAIDAARKGEL